MEIYRGLARRLEAVYDKDEARAVARWVMEEAFGLTLADLLADKDNAFGRDERARLSSLEERLLSGVPVQQAVGHTTFLGRRFTVNAHVLIPRPETEELVRLAGAERGGRVLDLGTGSGCIAVSLALLHPTWHVTALDISLRALATARLNARRLGARVDFCRRDMLTWEPREGEARYDLLVSNPPYIPSAERAGMEPLVTGHEPALALFVPDADPLLFYRAAARLAHGLLAEGGTLLVETHSRRAHEVAALFQREGLSHITVHADPFGLNRIVKAHL